MPQYFFDCYDKGAFHTDLSGTEITDHSEAAVQGACLARALMNEADDTFGPRAVTVIVRSEEGDVVYTAHCTFHGLHVPGQDQMRAISMPRPEGP